MEYFISKIEIDKSRNVKDFQIPLSNHERKHLIITGKNGSGKTSLLNDINQTVQQIEKQEKAYTSVLNRLDSLDNFPPYTSSEVKQIKVEKKQVKLRAKEITSTEVLLFGNTNSFWKELKKGNLLFVYFGAKRHAQMKIPKGIHKIDLKKKYTNEERVNQHFIQYIVNLKADQSFAKNDGEHEEAKKIAEWFELFEQRLSILFESDQLKLVFDRKTYDFEIQEPDKEPFNFNTLADGYSAIISVITELLLRMEGFGAKAYDMQGVVLIDEIETHLHVDLQKKVLPFLIDFFPKIQFVVTTHSPFVISSVSNAVICDLESRIITNNLTAYSYDALIESYFNADKYSEEVKRNIERYEILSDVINLTEEQQEEWYRLRQYFTHIPKHLTEELQVKLQQIQLKQLVKKGRK